MAAVVRRIEQAGGQPRRERVGPVEAVLGDFFEASVIARGQIRFTAVIAPLATVTAFTGTRWLGMALQDTIRAKQQLLYPHPAEFVAQH